MSVRAIETWTKWRRFDGIPLSLAGAMMLIEAPVTGAPFRPVWHGKDGDTNGLATAAALVERGLLEPWPLRGYSLTEKGVEIRTLVAEYMERERGAA